MHLCILFVVNAYAFTLIALLVLLRLPKNGLQNMMSIANANEQPCRCQINVKYHGLIHIKRWLPNGIENETISLAILLPPIVDLQIMFHRHSIFLSSTNCIYHGHILHLHTHLHFDIIIYVRRSLVSITRLEIIIDVRLSLVSVTRSTSPTAPSSSSPF